MNELNQALENVTFLKQLLNKGTYTTEDCAKVVRAMKFLLAIETGIEAKFHEPTKEVKSE